MKELIKDIAIAVIIVLAITFFIRPTIVKEESMLPTLLPDDYLIMSKQAYTIGEIERGDIIIFESNLLDENGDNKLLIKRAIALPGDTIDISDGVVTLNGTPIKEDYTISDYTDGDVDNLTVPEGMVFAMGDNRPVSNDSRSESVGLVDMDSIEGQAIFRLYPFDDFGVLD